MMGDEKKKVIKPEDEKKRIKDMAKEARLKKILTEDMKTFGPREVSKPMKSKDRMVGVVPEPGPMSGNMLEEKKKGGEVGMGMTKNNYKKGGKVSSCSKRADGCVVRGKTKGRMV
jgi:hypothetical protein